MTDVFKAIADPSRRALLDRLSVRNGQSLRDLSAGLAMSRQAVTKHLGVLEAAGLVISVRAGRERRHSLNPVPLLADLRPWLAKFERMPLGDLTGED